VDVLQLLASVLGLGFFSGVRLYATVFGLGMAIKYGLFQPASSLQSLSVLADTKVLIAAGVLCAIEFLADKVPWIDSIWDSIHTVVRPLAAGLMAATALGDFDPATKTILAVLAGGVALTSHSTKAATRLAVNHSPEPFSNFVLSVAEDLFVPAGLWFVFAHPLLFLTMLAIFLTVFTILAPKIFRLIRLEFTAAISAIGSWFTAGPVNPLPPAPASLHPSLVPLWNSLAPCLEPTGRGYGLRCAATRSIRQVRNSTGYLIFSPTELVFVTNRWFRQRTHSITADSIQGFQWKSGWLLDQLRLATVHGEIRFDVFKTAASPVLVSRLAPQSVKASVNS